MTQYIINLRANNTHNCEIFKSGAHTWLTVALSLRNTGQRAKPLKHRIPKVTHVKLFFFSFWQWAVKSYHCADPKKTKKAVGTIKKTTEIQYHFFSSWWVITFWVRVWINSLSLSVTKWDKEESCMHTQLIHDIQMNQILRNSGGMTLLQIYP